MDQMIDSFKGTSHPILPSPILGRSTLGLNVFTTWPINGASAEYWDPAKKAFVAGTINSTSSYRWEFDLGVQPTGTIVMRVTATFQNIPNSSTAFDLFEPNQAIIDGSYPGGGKGTSHPILPHFSKTGTVPRLHALTLEPFDSIVSIRVFDLNNSGKVTAVTPNTKGDQYFEVDLPAGAGQVLLIEMTVKFKSGVTRVGHGLYWE